MTYRVAEFRETCLTCGKEVAARCARCGDPFCSWHLSTDDEVCQVCEDGYQRQRMTRHDDRALGKAVALVVAVGAFTYLIVGIRLLGIGLGLGDPLRAVQPGRGAGVVARARRRRDARPGAGHPGCAVRRAKPADPGGPA